MVLSNLKLHFTTTRSSTFSGFNLALLGVTRSDLNFNYVLISNTCEEDVFQVFLCHFHFHDSDENEGLPVALTGQQLLGCHPCLRG